MFGHEEKPETFRDRMFDLQPWWEGTEGGMENREHRRTRYYFAKEAHKICG